MAYQIADDIGAPSLHIFTDNQASIRAITKPTRQSGQFLIRKIVRLMDRIRFKGTKVHIY